MYYDIHRHPEFEYIIYCRVGTAKPYIIPKLFESMNDVLDFLKEEEQRHSRYSKTIYVDNDFYENKHSINEKGTYYKILRRPVSDWEVAETKPKEKNRKKACKTKSSIIYLAQ